MRRKFKGRIQKGVTETETRKEKKDIKKRQDK